MRSSKEWMIFVALGALVLGLTFSDQITQLWKKSRADELPPQEEPEDPDARLIRLTKEMRLTPPALSGENEKTAATWGRQLFSDARFSANGNVACATCHDPRRSFTDGEVAARGVGLTTTNTPTILNAFTGSWFMWDGRADSLASQALKPVENPLEHGITRGRVAQLIWQNYRQDYERAHGSFPATLTRLFSTWGDRPFQAIPAPPELSIPMEVAAYAIATLSSFELQQRFILEGDVEDESPQRNLARAAVTSPPPDKQWVTQWNQLSPEQQKDINQVFAAFGQALAAYERGIVAHESPFDGFAARLLSGEPPENARGDGFGDSELRGLRFFVTKECVACHNGPSLSDHQFHNIGLPQRGEEVDLGRARGIQLVIADPFNCMGSFLPRTESESCLELPYLNTLNQEFVGARKTPTLRNIAETAPYMHDGRFATLDDVLTHYDAFPEEPAVGHREETLKPLRMTNGEREDLKAFLRSLTSPVKDFTVAAEPAK